MTTVPTATLRICYDCLAILANGELGQGDDAADAAHIAAMNAHWGEGEITLGCLDIECEDDGEECGFSWQSCPVCGSTLGGDRFHATGWVAP